MKTHLKQQGSYTCLGNLSEDWWSCGKGRMQLCPRTQWNQGLNHTSILSPSCVSVLLLPSPSLLTTFSPTWETWPEMAPRYVTHSLSFLVFHPNIMEKRLYYLRFIRCSPLDQSHKLRGRVPLDQCRCSPINHAYWGRRCF